MARSILLVDNDTEHRSRIARSVTEVGLTVAAQVTDPDEAMQLAATLRPDVAICTAAMGNGNGLHLVERLATEHGIPVVLLAPGPMSAALGLAAQRGVMGFLVEPVTPSSLRTTLEVAVCRHRELLNLRREVETLRRSIEERKVIERAKGLMMEVGSLTEREAYARIRQKSMDTQRPMVEIAKAVILAAEINQSSLGAPIPRQ